MTTGVRKIEATPGSCHRLPSAAVNVWFDYRRVWSAHPWVLAYAVIVVAVLVLSIVGTFTGGPLVILFIPGLFGVYIHHLLVQRRLH
jgi:hypothetical protein